MEYGREMTEEYWEEQEALAGQAPVDAPHQIQSFDDVGRFVYAGNAIFTLRSAKTGNRFTYKVTAKKGGDISFVGLLTGPNNDRDYSYLGLLSHDTGDRLMGVGKGKSCASPDAPSAKAFQYLLDYLWKRNDGKSLEIWHEGRCGRCGRKLTVPESVAAGLGPECASRV